MSASKPYFKSLGVHAKELPMLYGSAKLARRVVAAGWLKPVVAAHRCVIYDRIDVEAVWNRIKKGEQPPRLRRGE